MFHAENVFLIRINSQLFSIPLLWIFLFYTFFTLHRKTNQHHSIDKDYALCKPPQNMLIFFTVEHVNFN